MESVCIGQYFPAFRTNTKRFGISARIQSARMRKNTNQDNCEYGHFSHSGVDEGSEIVPFDVISLYTRFHHEFAFEALDYF